MISMGPTAHSSSVLNYFRNYATLQFWRCVAISYRNFCPRLQRC